MSLEGLFQAYLQSHMNNRWYHFDNSFAGESTSNNAVVGAGLNQGSKLKLLALIRGRINLSSLLHPYSTCIPECMESMIGQILDEPRMNKMSS